MDAPNEDDLRDHILEAQAKMEVWKILSHGFLPPTIDWDERNALFEQEKLKTIQKGRLHFVGTFGDALFRVNASSINTTLSTGDTLEKKINTISLVCVISVIPIKLHVLN